MAARNNKVGRVIFLLSAILAWGAYYGLPYVVDGNAPEVEARTSATKEIYQGEEKILFVVTDEAPGVRSVTMHFGDEEPEELTRGDKVGEYPFLFDTTKFPDGTHHLTLNATDKSLGRNEKTITFAIQVDNTPPEVQIFPKPLVVSQGRTLKLLIEANEAIAKLSGKLSDRELTFYPVTDKLRRCLIGIGVKEIPGIHPIELRIEDEIGHSTEKTIYLKVEKTKFESGGVVKLSKNKQKTMMNRSKVKEDNARRGKAYSLANDTSDLLWDGKFIRPTSGVVTSTFGKFRTYNTGVKRHHLGTDIANSKGTPVYAGNSGIVSFADRLHIYGNCVIINHGQGISSSYNHLSELKVEDGDAVAKGDLIGLMGATGQVTGSHLHWGMVVGGVGVAPEQWTAIDFSDSMIER